MQPLDLIAALARDRVIGSQGALPWHHPADLAHFRRETIRRVLVMGRVTWESLGGALDGRSVVMLSRRRPPTPDDVLVTDDPMAALAQARMRGARPDRRPVPMICGGEAVYRLYLPQVTRMLLTLIDEEHPGDRRFPAYDPDDWIETGRRQEGVLCFLTLERRETAREEERP